MALTPQQKRDRRAAASQQQRDDEAARKREYRQGHAQCRSIVLGRGGEKRFVQPLMQVRSRQMPCLMPRPCVLIGIVKTSWMQRWMHECMRHSC